MKPQVEKIFDDLDALLNFCRFNLLPFDPKDLYNRNSKSWRDFEYSKKIRRPWNGDRKFQNKNR